MPDDIETLELDASGLERVTEALGAMATRLEEAAKALRDVQAAAPRSLPAPVPGPAEAYDKARSPKTRSRPVKGDTDDEPEKEYGSFVERALRVLERSRVPLPGVLGNVVPRAGDMLDTLLPNWKALALGTGRLAAVAGAGAVAIGLMATAAEGAARALNEVRGAFVLSGGVLGDVTALIGHGMTAGEIPAAAAGLRARLGSEPYAIAAGQRLGLGFVPGRHIGPVDEARILEKAVEGLRRYYYQMERAGTQAQKELVLQDMLYNARQLGLDQYVDQILVSEKVWQNQKRTAELSKTLADPRYMQAARDLGGETRRLSLAWTNLKVAFGRAFIPSLTRLVERAANLFDSLARAFARLSAPVERFKARYPGTSQAMGDTAMDLAMLFLGGRFLGRGLRLGRGLLGRLGIGGAAEAAGKAGLNAAGKLGMDAAAKSAFDGLRTAAAWATGKLGLKALGRETAAATAQAVEKGMLKGLAAKVAGRLGAGAAANVIPGVGQILGAGMIAWTLFDMFKLLKGVVKDTKADATTKAKGRERDPVEENNRLLRELNGLLRQGLTGGGRRAQGAIPAGWTGIYFERGQRALGRSMGAFGV